MGERLPTAFELVFQPDRLTLGLVLPLTSVPSDEPDPLEQIAYARLAERLGFAALWVRDVPLNSPDYPDPQGHPDPWVLLGALAAQTETINLGSAAIVAPLRHPMHVAKGAISVDALSRGRMILGLGSGDRPPEFAAFGQAHDHRKEDFRRAWERIAKAVGIPSLVEPDIVVPDAPPFHLRPRLKHGAVPMVAIGSSQQTLGWIAREAAAWVTYYRPLEVQKDRYALWRQAVDRLQPAQFRGFGQSFHLHLLADRHAPAEQLPLGAKLGALALIDTLRDYRRMGAQHIMFNLNAVGRPIAEVLGEIAAEVLPHIND